MSGGILKRVANALKGKELFARKTLLGMPQWGELECQSRMPPGKDTMWRRWVAV
jgi:hypothetical protein